jgi:hypothetical protein
MPAPLLVRPGKRDDDPITARLDRVEAVVAIPGLPSRCDPSGESLTGLSGAASGRRPPGPQEPAPSPPLHIRVDQRDERLEVAVTERLVRGAKRLDSHPERLLRHQARGCQELTSRHQARTARLGRTCLGKLGDLPSRGAAAPLNRQALLRSRYCRSSCACDARSPCAVARRHGSGR